MKCANCQTDNPAAARFCLNCGVPLLSRCPNCQAELPAGARFCMHCGQPVRSVTAADDARLTRLAAAAPGPLAEKVKAAADLAGERRVVTVLFADVVGSTALAEQLGAETWMAVMNQAFDRIMPAIYRYEGTIARLVGDGLWAFFGAPVAHEDDPVRGVRAALDLISAAKAYGAEVTGVCSTRNAEIVRAMGADHVVDYPREDFTEGEERYDFIFDNVAARSRSATRRAVSPTGTLLTNSAPVRGWFGGIGAPIATFVSSMFNPKQGRPFVSKTRPEDLAVLRDLAETGKITPALDTAYPLAQTPEAVAHVGEGHAQGKTTITIL